MAYKVIKTFQDAQDNLFVYHAGDEYPRKGMKVSEKRIEELSSNKNRRGIPLIEEVETEKKAEKPKTTKKKSTKND